MSWRERFRPASFRGVRFSIEGSDTDVGRRVVQHVYPKRDRPYTEDMGRSPRSYQVDAFIIGENYDRQRDRLIEACEQEGAGQLVHPYHGTLSVICTALRVRETIGEQRLARVSLTFAEAGSNEFPRAEANRLSRVDQAAKATTDASADVLAEGFSLTGLPEFVRSDAVATLTNAADAARAAQSKVGQASAEASSAVDKLANDAEDLVTAPADMASQITGTINTVADRLSLASDAMSAATDLRTFMNDSDPVPNTTGTRQQQSDNRELQRQHVNISALSASVRAASRVEWTTRQQAEENRDELLGWIEDIERGTGDIGRAVDDSKLYVALQELRSQLSQAVPPEGERLPELEQVTLDATTPALVVAQRLYGDPSRAEEIVSRNNVRHPGEVPGGEPLEIVRRG